MPGQRRLMIGDYCLSGGRIYLRKTGNSAALDLRLLREVASWLVCFLIVTARAAALHIWRPGPAIWFTPDVPHPRYMVRIAAMWAGMRVAASSGDADAAFYFEDATRAAAPAPPIGPALNFGCADISKSRVARVFEAVFGYPLSIDPNSWDGPAVEKSETNGAHDGRIVACPMVAQPGRIYQRLIDTLGPGGFTYDLRTHCAGGRALVVWVKRRDPAAQFLPPNLGVVRQRPEAVFTAAELDRIATFVAAMGADWCSLDILRDRDDRIYVVDVNKTDAGPITALSLREKLLGIAILAKSLRSMIDG